VDAVCGVTVEDDGTVSLDCACASAHAVAAEEIFEMPLISMIPPFYFKLRTFSIVLSACIAHSFKSI
jgi:hypothetical protein